MKTKISIVCALAVFTAFLLSCSPDSGQTSLEVSCDDFMSQNHITKEMSVKAGESFTVTLCSNPTTGFQWESAQISDQSVLAETGHQFVSPEDENLVGAAGQELWTFQALKKGDSTISMTYRRPWESGEGEWTFTLNVMVK